jgi:ornithine carbamoyltransferase
MRRSRSGGVSIPVRHLLSISELDSETLRSLVENAVAIAGGHWEGKRPLAGRVVGTYFRKTSTRTRTSFTVGALKLGAQVSPFISMVGRQSLELWTRGLKVCPGQSPTTRPNSSTS